MTDEQWRELESLAGSFADLQSAPSAGQIAGVLIGMALPMVEGKSSHLRREFQKKIIT